MKFITIFFFATLIYANSNELRAQHSASSPIQLNIAKRNVSERYDLDLSARLISKWQKPIAVPNDFTWGQLTASNFAFLLVELQQKVGRRYNEVLLDANIDNVIPFYIDSLYKGDSAESHDFSLAGLAKFTIGDYRVRVLCRLSAFNPGMKDIYSKWLYFKCVKEVPFH